MGGDHTATLGYWELGADVALEGIEHFCNRYPLHQSTEGPALSLVVPNRSLGDLGAAASQPPRRKLASLYTIGSSPTELQPTDPWPLRVTTCRLSPCLVEGTRRTGSPGSRESEGRDGALCSF